MKRNPSVTIFPLILFWFSTFQVFKLIAITILKGDIIGRRRSGSRRRTLNIKQIAKCTELKRKKNKTKQNTLKQKLTQVASL